MNSIISHYIYLYYYYYYYINGDVAIKFFILSLCHIIHLLSTSFFFFLFKLFLLFILKWKKKKLFFSLLVNTYRQFVTLSLQLFLSFFAYLSPHFSLFYLYTFFIIFPLLYFDSFSPFLSCTNLIVRTLCVHETLFFMCLV